MPCEWLGFMQHFWRNTVYYEFKSAMCTDFLCAMCCRETSSAVYEDIPRPLRGLLVPRARSTSRCHCRLSTGALAPQPSCLPPMQSPPAPTTYTRLTFAFSSQARGQTQKANTLSLIDSTYAHTHTHTHIYIYIYIYIHTCGCM